MEKYTKRSQGNDHLCRKRKRVQILNETVCISNSANTPRMESSLYKYHLLVWSNINFFHNSLCFTFSTQSCLILLLFCARWLHSLIILLIFCLYPHLLYSCYNLLILIYFCFHIVGAYGVVQLFLKVALSKSCLCLV